MRRVLLVDDPRQAPRLARLQEQAVGVWDVVVAPREQTDFWRLLGLCHGAMVISAGDVDSQVPAGESTDILVAATSPTLLKVASNLGFRRGSTLAVLPAAAQTADWIFSLYPLSEEAQPRVRGVFEHRGSPAVLAFR
ncbi:MAG TPA: hypothetical protein VM510_05800, partial [Caulifigura sp.]|nr:hypothetical protein [Caulifigura sp.]